MTHDVVVLPFRRAGYKSSVAKSSLAASSSPLCEHASAIVPLSVATTEPVCSPLARVDIDAMSVAIALRYLSGRLRVSVRTKR